MAGLIQESVDQGASAISGLEAATVQAKDQYLQDLGLKQSQQAGLGAVIGTAVGYGAARKKKPDKKPQPELPSNDPSRTRTAPEDSEGTPHSMLFGTLLNHLGGGILNQHRMSSSDTDDTPAEGGGN